MVLLLLYMILKPSLYLGTSDLTNYSSDNNITTFQQNTEPHLTDKWNVWLMLTHNIPAILSDIWTKLSWNISDKRGPCAEGLRLSWCWSPELAVFVRESRAGRAAGLWPVTRSQHWWHETTAHTVSSHIGPGIGTMPLFISLIYPLENTRHNWTCGGIISIPITQ